MKSDLNNVLTLTGCSLRPQHTLRSPKVHVLSHIPQPRIPKAPKMRTGRRAHAPNRFSVEWTQGPEACEPYVCMQLKISVVMSILWEAVRFSGLKVTSTDSQFRIYCLQLQRTTKTYLQRKTIYVPLNHKHLWHSSYFWAAKISLTSLSIASSTVSFSMASQPRTGKRAELAP